MISFYYPRNNFLLNDERNLRTAEMTANSCPGYCSGHSDDFLPARGMNNREAQQPWGTVTTEPASEHKLPSARDNWNSRRASCGTKQVASTDYFHVDDNDDDVPGRKHISPEIPFVKGERVVFDDHSGRSVDFEKACKVRKTGKNHPSRDQQTQTLHETASAFVNPADSSRERDYIEMSRQNHSPVVKMQAGNSFQLIPTFIPVPSDANGACFLSPTLGYPVSASAHAPFAQMPSTTHVLHPGNSGAQDHFVYLPSQVYSHVPRAVSTVYTSHVPPNVTTVGSPSAMPVLFAPGRVAYKGPHAPVPNFAIPAPTFVPSSSPTASMRHNQAPGNVNTYRQYLMRPRSHVLQPMYQ